MDYVTLRQYQSNRVGYSGPATCTVWSFLMGNYRTLDGVLVDRHCILNLVKNRLAQTSVGEMPAYM